MIHNFIQELEELVREIKGGEKTYDTLIVDYPENLDVRDFLVGVFSLGNSFRIKWVLFLTFKFWTTATYTDWLIVLEKVANIADKTVLNKFFYLTYQYLEVSFEDALFEHDAISENSQLAIQQYWFRTTSQGQRVPVTGLLYSEIEEKEIRLFGLQTSDFHLYRDRLILEGAEKATKRKNTSTPVEVETSPIRKLLNRLDPQHLKEFNGTPGLNLFNDLTPLHELIEKSDPIVIKEFFEEYPNIMRKIYPSEED
ncbi:MAG: hypothetical protein AAF587_00430 [Bacteroidota bacterium]